MPESAHGLSQDSADYIYAGTGNSNQGSSPDPYDYSDGVIKLDPNNLHPGQPYDYFAPSPWYQDNAGDSDLGSTTPPQLPNNRVFIVGKSGMGHLLDSQRLGHIGGELAAHQVCNATGDAAFGALAYAHGTVPTAASGRPGTAWSPSSGAFATSPRPGSLGRALWPSVPTRCSPRGRAAAGLPAGRRRPPLGGLVLRADIQPEPGRPEHRTSRQRCRPGEPGLCPRCRHHPRRRPVAGLLAGSRPPSSG
jgi:hypothetical protein